MVIGGIKGLGGKIPGIASIPRDNTLSTFNSNYENFLLGTKTTDLFYGYLTTDAVEVPTMWLETFTSTKSETSVAVSETTYTKKIDIDFDSSVQAERIIGGKARINGNINIVAPQGVGPIRYMDAYLVATLKKYDGSSEVTLGSSQTNALYAENSGSDSDDFNMIMDIARTSFTNEDTLRLTIEGWARIPAGSTGGSPAITIEHDGVWKIQIPFAKLDEY